MSSPRPQTNASWLLGRGTIKRCDLRRAGGRGDFRIKRGQGFFVPFLPSLPAPPHCNAFAQPRVKKFGAVRLFVRPSVTTVHQRKCEVGLSERLRRYSNSLCLDLPCHAACLNDLGDWFCEKISHVNTVMLGFPSSSQFLAIKHWSRKDVRSSTCACSGLP